MLHSRLLWTPTVSQMHDGRLKNWERIPARVANTAQWSSLCERLNSVLGLNWYVSLTRKEKYATTVLFPCILFFSLRFR